MRHELTDYEWTAIKAMLPNKLRGVPRMSGRELKNVRGLACKVRRSPNRPNLLQRSECGDVPLPDLTGNKRSSVSGLSRCRTILGSVVVEQNREPG